MPDVPPPEPHHRIRDRPRAGLRRARPDGRPHRHDRRRRPRRVLEGRVGPRPRGAAGAGVRRRRSPRRGGRVPTDVVCAGAAGRGRSPTSCGGRRRGPGGPDPPGPVVLVGHSAGGHLVALAATRPRGRDAGRRGRPGRLRRPRAHPDLGLGDGAAARFMGDADGAAWTAADPAAHPRPRAAGAHPRRGRRHGPRGGRRAVPGPAGTDGGARADPAARRRRTASSSSPERPPSGWSSMRWPG